MINYADKGEWKKFVEDYVIPLRDSAEALVEHWRYLKREIEGVEIDGMEEDLKKILLGGVDDEGNYLEFSVAKFYKDFFGVSLSVELPKYVTAVKEGATKGIKGMVQAQTYYPGAKATHSIKFILDVAEQTKKIANIALSKGIIDTAAGSSSGIKHEELLMNPEAVVEDIGDFYNRCAKIAPNYNDYSLFILTIRSITRRYLEEAYPQFKDKFSELQPFFGLVPLFEPNIEDRTRKAEYTIWYLPEGSFGGEIRKLYEMVWDYSSKFKDLLLQYFEGITDLKKEFIEDAKISVTGTITEIFKIERLLSSRHTLTFHGQWISSIEPYSYNLKEPTSLMHVLDDVMPFLFVGLVNITGVFGNELWIEPIK
ncbi:MAG: hypothetical protein QMD80_07495 [archaeon]|nr:hypothetical protein [archaeon]